MLPRKADHVQEGEPPFVEAVRRLEHGIGSEGRDVILVPYSMVSSYDAPKVRTEGGELVRARLFVREPDSMGNIEWKPLSVDEFFDKCAHENKIDAKISRHKKFLLTSTHYALYATREHGFRKSTQTNASTFHTKGNPG